MALVDRLGFYIRLWSTTQVVYPFICLSVEIYFRRNHKELNNCYDKGRLKKKEINLDFHVPTFKCTVFFFPFYERLFVYKFVQWTIKYLEDFNYDCYTRLYSRQNVIYCIPEIKCLIKERLAISTRNFFFFLNIFVFNARSLSLFFSSFVSPSLSLLLSDIVAFFHPLFFSLSHLGTYKSRWKFLVKRSK